MSPEHVETMNSLLLDARGVRDECAKLPRPYAIGYRLSDGPQGSTVHWTVTFGDTVEFSLTEHPAPDAVFVGSWRRMIEAAAAGRAGVVRDPGLTVEGDEKAFSAVAAAFAQAQAVATVTVTFPEHGS